MFPPKRFDSFSPLLTGWILRKFRFVADEVVQKLKFRTSFKKKKPVLYLTKMFSQQVGLAIIQG